MEVDVEGEQGQLSLLNNEYFEQVPHQGNVQRFKTIVVLSY
jgi:hypothetical protein